MASSADRGEVSETPQILFSAPTVGSTQQASGSSSKPSASGVHRRRLSKSKPQGARRVRIQAPGPGSTSPASSIYMGSYGHNARQSRSSLASARSASLPPASPRVSISHSHLESLLQDVDQDLDTYGVEELRDGFFDASFFKPPEVDREELMKDAEETLPIAFQKKHPLSPKHFLPRQWQGIKDFIRAVTTTRAGIKLAKSFLAFFIAYILCLVPVIANWLGRYHYIMVISTLINHPGRTIGAQIDGAFLTITGTATGLGWGAFALWLSDSTAVARRGYGGILAAFLVLFMGTIAALRSYYVRMYQFVLCAGIAALYTLLAETSEEVNWRKLFSYGIPWVFGQALSMIVCCTFFPDAGSRPLAVNLHNAFGVMQDGLILPQKHSIMLERQLEWTFVNLSEVYRDLVLDISITRFRPKDVMLLRNLMQAVIRSLLSLKMESHLFDNFERTRSRNSAFDQLRNTPSDSQTSSEGSESGEGETVIDIDETAKRPTIQRTDSEERAVALVADRLSEPTSNLLSCMRSSLARCDAVLMDMSGYRKYIGPPKETSNDILGSLTKIRKVMIRYDEAEDSLMHNPDLPPTYSNHPEVVELFLFVHPIRQAAHSVEALLVKVNEMQQRHPGWRPYLPSYPWRKSLQRTNAQVRHDRGGVTAGFYFKSQSQLARTMRGMANIYKPLPRHHSIPTREEEGLGVTRTDTMGKYEEEEEVARDRSSGASSQKRFRYRLWMVLHRLQGFETRFALKVAISTSLLAIPAWLSQSRGWWNQHESWWAVVMVWIMSHPRVGGNIQDLVTRSLCGVLGAVWGGLAYGARDGNPYVMAAFAAIYMIPMIYRFTQSPHPRSGIVGCISFVVVSLAAKSNEDVSSVAMIAWTRGVAIVVGVVAAVVINWFLWPFVARHELRKALAAMMIYSSIIYRGVVAKYVYYEKGEEPTKEDIERSEMLEGRLREGFVRIRQLMALTRHEIRLRGPFDPLPYSALIAACERFFEYLVSVRQSSLFFHPHYISSSSDASTALLSYRRDAAAAILMNLYILAGALRNGRKVPRYLPSAALARSRLLRKMAQVEEEVEERRVERVRSGESEEGIKKWSQIYSYSYSQSLTGCVKELEMLVVFTKEICGELGFGFADTMMFEDEDLPPEESKSSRKKNKARA